MARRQLMRRNIPRDLRETLHRFSVVSPLASTAQRSLLASLSMASTMPCRSFSIASHDKEVNSESIGRCRFQWWRYKSQSTIQVAPVLLLLCACVAVEARVENDAILIGERSSSRRQERRKRRRKTSRLRLNCASTRIHCVGFPTCEPRPIRMRDASESNSVGVDNLDAALADPADLLGPLSNAQSVSSSVLHASHASDSAVVCSIRPHRDNSGRQLVIQLE